MANAILKIGSWTVLREQNRLASGERDITLSPKAMDILVALLQAEGQTLAKEELVKIVWGRESVSDESLHAAISKLRRAIAPEPDLNGLLITVPRRGYRIAQELTQSVSDLESPAGPDAGRWIPAAGLALVAIAGFAAIMTSTMDQGRVSVEPEPRIRPLTHYRGQERAASFSPDGGSAVFAWSGESGSEWDLYVLRVGDVEPTRLTSDRAYEVSPRWSPDGRHIAYSKVSKQACRIELISLIDRQVTTLRPCDAGRDTDLAWGPTANELYFVDRVGDDGPLAIWLMDLSSGQERQVSFPPDGYFGDLMPAVDASGGRLAVARTHDVGVTELHMIDLTTGDDIALTHDRMKIHGLAWDPASSDIIYSSNRGGEFGLWRIAPGANPIALLPAPGSADSVSVSSDGARIIFEREKTISNLVTFTVGGPEAPIEQAQSTGWEWHPAYSPDGASLTYVSDRTGTPEIWTTDLNRGVSIQLTHLDGPYVDSPSWSPDGEAIAFSAPIDGNYEIYVLDVASREINRLTDNGASDRVPAFSSDGSTMYFSSNRSGRWEIWSMNRSGEQMRQVTFAGGFGAQVSPNGEQLYFTRRTEPGLFRLRLPEADGPATRILNDIAPIDWANWTLHDDTVLYVVRGPGFEPMLNAFDLAQRTSAEGGRLLGFHHRSGLAVAPGDSRITYSRQEGVESDLVMIESARATARRSMLHD